MNNVTYYSYFDTVVNEHLVRAGGLDIRDAPVIGVVVETSCRFHRPLSFPGHHRRRACASRSSATRRSPTKSRLFRSGDDAPAATGRFVHVWVDRATQRPVAGARRASARRWRRWSVMRRREHADAA